MQNAPRPKDRPPQSSGSNARCTSQSPQNWGLGGENGATVQDAGPVIAILYALPDECRFFGDGISALKIVREDGAARIAPEGNRPGAESLAISLRIGVGPRRAAENSALLLTGRPVSAVIVVGFAGGLAAGLAPGSVVVAEAVTDSLSGRRYAADTTLIAAAAQVVPPEVRVARGLVATMDRVLIRADEKRDFGRSTRSLAVDMESAGVAASATDCGVPWLAVRVITDGVEDDLPFDFNAETLQAYGDPYGGLDRGRIVASALLHLWKIPALIRLGKRSSLAARNLAAFLHALLPRLAP